MADWTCSGTGTCKKCGEQVEWWKTDKGANMPVNPRPDEPFYGEGDTRPSGEVYGRNHFDTCEGSNDGEAKPKPASQAKQPAAAAQPAKPDVPVLVHLMSALTLHLIGKRPITALRISEKGAPHIPESQRAMIENVAKIPVVEDFAIEKGFFKIDPDWRDPDPDETIPF